MRPPNCHCQPTADLTWCPYHGIFKTRHWIHLCQTKPAYRHAWDNGTGPGQANTSTPTKIPAWLTCPHRGPQAAQLPARDYGCGCGFIQFHKCNHFDELVVLKLRHDAKQALVGAIVGYTGRACNQCELYAGKTKGT